MKKEKRFSLGTKLSSVVITLWLLPVIVIQATNQATSQPTIKESCVVICVVSGVAVRTFVYTCNLWGVDIFLFLFAFI